MLHRTVLLVMLTLGVSLACGDMPSQPFFRLSLSSVVTGRVHACYLASGGTVYCWGDNTYGQLGDESNVPKTTAVQVAGDISFTKLTSGGYHHTCGLTKEGEAYCWGQNAFGQLGDGTATNRNVPVRSAADYRFLTLDAGTYHTCGITSAGEAYCWGSNGAVGIEGYPLGSATTRECDNPLPSYRGATWPCSLTPVEVSGGISFQSISAGLWITCGIAVSSETYCWGWNNFYQLGDGSESTVAATEPRLVAGGFEFDNMGIGGVHGCGVANEAAYCWGGLMFNSGQLGTGSFESSSGPAAVVGDLEFSTIHPAAGNNVWAFTCGLTPTGDAYCWGANSYGVLGTNVSNLSTCGSTVPCISSPVRVADEISFSSIATSGNGFACGVSRTGGVYCWGRNDSGQLGDGTANDSAIPVLVALPDA